MVCDCFTVLTTWAGNVGRLCVYDDLEVELVFVDSTAFEECRQQVQSSLTDNSYGDESAAFWPKTECVLAQNRMRFDPKWSAFWPKMEDVLIQNAFRFHTKRPPF